MWFRLRTIFYWIVEQYLISCSGCYCNGRVGALWHSSTAQAEWVRNRAVWWIWPSAQTTTFNLCGLKGQLWTILSCISHRTEWAHAAVTNHVMKKQHLPWVEQNWSGIYGQWVLSGLILCRSTWIEFRITSKAPKFLLVKITGINICCWTFLTELPTVFTFAYKYEVQVNFQENMSW